LDKKQFGFNKHIDISFDVRSDSGGKDPDYASKTLRQYHKLLWSKNLPNGHHFDLDDTLENAYLYHKSDFGEFYLASDSVIHTYYRWKRTQHIIEQIPKDEMEYFFGLAYTIGGIMIFPGNRINGLNTMNQERGLNRKINDRMDLTLECIRRYYIDEDSPLMGTIKRYSDYFELFSDFKGYCEYFLLQDLVQDSEIDNSSKINFFLPFEGFISNPLPKSVDEYNEYKRNNIVFLNKRNIRIEDYSRDIIQSHQT